MQWGRASISRSGLAVSLVKALLCVYWIQYVMAALVPMPSLGACLRQFIIQSPQRRRVFDQTTARHIRVRMKQAIWLYCQVHLAASMPAICLSVAWACLFAITIDWINNGGEVSIPFKACLLIHILLPSCRALQNFLRLAIPIAFDVSVIELNVKDSRPALLPKAVCSNISMGFVIQHFICIPLCCIQSPPIEDFRFGGDPGGRQGYQKKCANSLHTKPMLHRKGFIASITAFWKAPGV